MSLKEELTKILVQGAVDRKFFEAKLNIYDGTECTISRPKHSDEITVDIKKVEK